MVGKKLLRNLIFIAGFMLCSYPLASNVIEGFYQKEAVATYNQAVENTDANDLEEKFIQGEEYNRVLSNQKNVSLENVSGDTSILGEESYDSILNMGNGVMGSIEIPKINVNLPIYHGTSDEVLSVGVGHVYGSSFPIGGTNTRSVLSGHRGLPNAKLFTRLDEIVEGDLFFIRVLNRTLAYKVSDIMVIEPDDIDSVDIVADKDLVSLVTCTPYGINTHRLVVTGERTEYEPAIYENIESKNMSIRECVFLAIPFVFLTIIVGRRIKSAKKKD